MHTSDKNAPTGIYSKWVENGLFYGMIFLPKDSPLVAFTGFTLWRPYPLIGRREGNKGAAFGRLDATKGESFADKKVL